MVIDLILIALLCLFSFKGYKKGFLSTLFSIFCFFISIYLTYLLLPLFSSLVGTIIPIDKLISGIIQDSDFLNNIVTSDNKLYALLRILLRIDANSLTQTVSSVVLNIVSFIVLSIIIRFVLKIISKWLIKVLKKFFIANSFDRLCGVCFGFLKGVIIACLICFVITSIADYDSANILKPQISQSSLLPAFNQGIE